MNIQPTILAGIDFQIAQIQDWLESEVDNIDFDIYGRIRKSEKEGKYYPECYISAGEYRQVFNDDSRSGVVGFYVKDIRQNLPIKKADVDIIFTVQPDKLITGATDEQVLMYFEQLLEKVVDIEGIKTGIQQVFADFDRDSIRYRDMYPFFVFSFQTTIVYDNNFCDL